MKTILPALGVAAIAAASAVAQTVTLAPSYGSITLDSGFLPDPYSVQMRAGGNISVSSNVNGSGVCRGYIANAPDFNLYYSAGQFELYLSAISQTDTTLVVRDPRGNWFCDDDGGEGLNPAINIDRPASGLYSVWVGTYSSSAGLPPATLYVSEIGFGPRPQGVGLNPSLAANYGSRSLRAGFTPDPVNVSIAAGGDIDVSESGLQGCWGYATASPDYELTYSAGNTFDLYLSATSERDTVIIVNAPDGSWHCNDDGAEGLNPGLVFQNPQSGVYDIWVGTYSSSAGTPPATLHISELGFGGQTAPQASSMLDYTLPSNYGSVSLNSGFIPDPYNVQLAAGGNIDVSETGLPGCWGYATAAPDFELTYSAGNAFDLYLSATSSRDTVMIVNAPDGTWHCNDDGAEGLNPGLMFQNPQSGVYDIWVGTYSSSAGTPPATLHISELGFGGETVVDGNMLDYALPANYGSVSLNSGFLPDPYNVQIAAGGNIDVRQNGPDGCWGYTTAAPDFELTYSAGNTFDLYLSATSSRDTVIIVNAPDGTWHCNDDGAEGLNPGLMFENPQSGVYDIWVGTYSSSAGTPPATLHISEIEFGN